MNEEQQINIHMIAELRKENEMLKNRFTTMEMEYSSTFDTIKEQSLSKDREIKNLRSKITYNDNTHLELVKCLKKEFEISKIEYQKKILNLQKQLETLKELESSFTKSLQEKKEIQNQYIEKTKYEAELKRTILESEITHNREKEDLSSMLRVLQEREHKKLDERAKQLLSSKTKETYEENELVKNELRIIQIKFKKVCEDNTKLKEKIKAVKRKNSLDKGTIKEYINQGFKLNRELKVYKNKTSKLEKSIDNILHKHENMIFKLKNESDQIITGLNNKLNDKTNLLRIRTTELINLKRICKRILLQRSELEYFFMDSLAYVKNQLRSEFPPISLHAQQSRKLSIQRNVDNDNDDNDRTTTSMNRFDKLSWGDKERVLKLLFARINGKNIKQKKTHSKRSKITRIQKMSRSTSLN